MHAPTQPLAQPLQSGGAGSAEQEQQAVGLLLPGTAQLPIAFMESVFSQPKSQEFATHAPQSLAAGRTVKSER